MEVHFVYAESFKLDGGACFGVVPKSMWSKLYPPDENNMLRCSLRNLLVKDGERLILFDTGIGNKQDDKFRSHFFVEGLDNLAKSFKSKGFSPLQVTEVVHTHLHFDHCGGTFRKNDKGDTVPVFKNATYWCSKVQWNWAKNANVREKASYLNENIEPIENSGKLKMIEKECQLTKNISLKQVNGHTMGQMIPMIKYKGKNLVYMADFIPTAWHVSLPYVASFDTQPLVSMDEKTTFVNEAADHNYILLFQHDAINECCTVEHTEKGVKIKESGTLEYFLKK
jgi:glyoxylase-like metal-dependent hydrolase (beta-lactamase superfamily II)